MAPRSRQEGLLGRSVRCARKAKGEWMYFRKITEAEEQKLKRELFPGEA